jgi:hypothetical protein
VAAITPVLSGPYIYNWAESCVGSATTSFMSGVVTFTPKTKVVTLNVYQTGGNPTLTLTHISGSGTYSNTSTTFTWQHAGAPQTTYQATYGALLSGNIAANVSWIAVVENGKCADMAWLTRQ